MDFEYFVLEAAERVLGWEYSEEFSDEALSQAVSDQAALMAKACSDQMNIGHMSHRPEYRAFHW